MSVIVLPQPRVAKGGSLPEICSPAPKIPVPPYDQALPPEYWENLRRTNSNKASYPARARRPFAWIGVSALVACVSWALWSITAKSLKQAEFPAPVLHSGDLEINPPAAPVPTPATIAPRATLVKSPPRVRRAELVIPQTGQSYWVNMPDGRHIVIHYLGEVSDYAHLPVQHGVTNAAYHTIADGSTWIWTVPVGASNVAQWIDP
jgi:hypothetical protein